MGPMKQTVKEARLARGWTQQQLAEKAQISATLIARIEQGTGGATFAQAQMLADALGASVHDLKVPEHRGRGRPVREGRELLEPFYLPGRYDPAEGKPAELTLPAARRAYSSAMCALDQRMTPEWERFLGVAPSDSALETVNWLLELQRGARFCEVSPQEVGF